MQALQVPSSAGPSSAGPSADLSVGSSNIRADAEIRPEERCTVVERIPLRAEKRTVQAELARKGVGQARRSGQTGRAVRVGRLKIETT